MGSSRRWWSNQDTHSSVANSTAQYASQTHMALLARHGLGCNMSRKGNCWGNAVMECFFLNLKWERVWQRDYANHADAQADIADYIVSFYNPIRLHSTRGFGRPANMSNGEQRHTELQTSPIGVFEKLDHDTWIWWIWSKRLGRRWTGGRSKPCCVRGCNGWRSAVQASMLVTTMSTSVSFSIPRSL